MIAFGKSSLLFSGHRGNFENPGDSPVALLQWSLQGCVLRMRMLSAVLASCRGRRNVCSFRLCWGFAVIFQVKKLKFYSLALKKWWAWKLEIYHGKGKEKKKIVNKWSKDSENLVFSVVLENAMRTTKNQKCPLIFYWDYTKSTEEVTH